MSKLNQTSLNILHRVVECSTCSQIFLVSPPDQSHTGPSVRSPGIDADAIMVEHVCSQGHGTDIYRMNPHQRL